MANNSAVTRDGAEIGRAQALQAAAARGRARGGHEPGPAQALGRAPQPGPAHGPPLRRRATRAATRSSSPSCARRCSTRSPTCATRYDVVICEGAGSPAEINLRAGDIANMRLARAADLPVVLVGDIDRGGVFAALYGTLALLEPDDQALVAGLRHQQVPRRRHAPRPGARAAAGADRPPDARGAAVARRDVARRRGLARARGASARAAAARGGDTLDVAVVRLRWMTNFTDVDALAAEPGVSVRFTRSPADVERADLVVAARDEGDGRGPRAAARRRPRRRPARRAAAGGPILGICGGYQMLGHAIEDEVESRRGTVAGLGLLPVRTRFVPEKRLRRVPERSRWPAGHRPPATRSATASRRATAGRR